MELKDLKSSRKFSLLQYGETGTGKSYRAAQAVHFGPIFIFDFDNKIQSVFEWFEDKPELLNNIHYETFADAGGSSTGCLRTYAKLREMWTMVRDGKFPYSTIIWDSWTAWESLYMNQVMASNAKFERMTTQIYKDEKSGKTESISTPQMADYRIHAHNQQQFITELTTFPCNVIVNAHIALKEEEHTGRIERGMAAAGKLSKLLPKFFTEVHRTFVDKGQYRVQVRSDTMWPCNTRLQKVDQSGTIDCAIQHLKPMAMIKSPITNQTSEEKSNE